MCGRYSLARDLEAVIRRFAFVPEDPWPLPRYNVAPGTPVLGILTVGGERRGRLFRWGLVPPFRRGREGGEEPAPLINARAETAHERPAFRQALRVRRVIVPADGFYEWARVGKRKVPFRFVLRSRDLFGLAGLWEAWVAPDGRLVRTLAILTTEANALVRPVHSRMPVILRPELEELWLDPGVRDPAMLAPALRPYPEDEMEAYRVSSRVSAPACDDESCIAPAETP